MKIINKLKRVFFEILTGAVVFSLLMGITFGLIYLIGLFKNDISYVILGIIFTFVIFKIGKETLETIEYCRKSKAELKEFVEKYKED